MNYIYFCIFLTFQYVYKKLKYVDYGSFLRAKAAMLSARLSHRNSVRPSVRPSVRLSHVWIRQKRSKLESPNLHRRLLGRL